MKWQGESWDTPHLEMCSNTQGEKENHEFVPTNSAYCRTQMWQVGSTVSASYISTEHCSKKLDSQNEINPNKYLKRERHKGLVSALWIKDRNSDLQSGSSTEGQGGHWECGCGMETNGARLWWTPGQHQDNTETDTKGWRETLSFLTFIWFVPIVSVMIEDRIIPFHFTLFICLFTLLFLQRS